MMAYYKIFKIVELKDWTLTDSLFIQSYLSNRNFELGLSTTVCEKYDQEAGVPQGGIISTTSFIHLVSKNVPSLTSYNLVKHSSITITFGTLVIEKVGNQNILYFPTSPN